MGIYIYEQDAVAIEGNTIIPGGYSSFYGIYLTYCDNASSIVKNKITGSNNGGVGIYVDNCYGTSSNPCLIANNFISLYTSGNSCYGIYNYYGYYINYYYNSINITGNYTTSMAMRYFGYSNSYIKFKNNCFINQAQGYAFWASSSYGFTSDYNDFYSNGTYIGYFSGYQPTLTNWQSASSQDYNSISINADYLSATDLHTLKIDLNGKGTPVSGVSDDIDGQSRNVSTPDIGADEFDPAHVDAGIVALNYPTTPCKHGLQPIKVSIKNFATDTLVSATIEWKLDGVTQSPFSWTGLVLTGDTAKSVIIDTVNLTYGNHILKIWTKNPNSTMDGNRVNDSMQFSLQAKNPLSGTYTIGPRLTDSFVNFREAVDSLISNGVEGAVTFLVKDSTYTEQLNIPAILGASASNTITFRSASGDSTRVILQYPAGYLNYVIWLHGADFITFKGMTLKNTNYNYQIVAGITNNANNNTFKNNIIEGSTCPNTGSYGSLIYSENSNDNDLQIINNIFKYGSMGVYLQGNSSSNLESGLKITGNSFREQYYTAISLYYCGSPEISGNEIIATNSYSYFMGIYLNYCYNKLFISKNKLNIPQGGYGIYIYNCIGTSSNTGLISNNFVYLGGNNYAYGLLAYYSSYINFYYNSINVTSSSSGSNNACSYFYSGDNINLKNNILCNSGIGYAIYAGSLYAIAGSDYNDLYTNGSRLGYYSGDRSNLAQWRTFSSQDVHSKSVDPLYFSNSNLHVREILLNRSGIPLSAVTDDIDGNVRNLTNPDIGADEFNPGANDAGVVALIKPVSPFAADTQAIKVRIRNFGLDTLRSVHINWKLKGITQTAFNWSGNLASGDTVSVTIGSHIFAYDTTYTFAAWTSLPNGTSDNNLLNDSFVFNNLHAALSGTYTIGGSSPNFTNFSNALNALKLGGIRGSVIFNVRNGTYTEQLNFPQITGASTSGSIRFQSESGDSSRVILQYSANSTDNYTIKLNGSDGITFRKMTIKSLNTNYGKVVLFASNANNNLIENCVLRGINSSSTSSDIALISCYYDLNNNNSFLNNRFQFGSDALYWYGYNSPTYLLNTTIQKNVFDSQSYMGIYAIYQDGLTIRDNKFNFLATSSFRYPVYLENCYGKTTVTGNDIRLGYGYGLYLNNCQATVSNPSLIANNFISVGGGSSTNAVYMYYNNYFNFYYNSVNLYNSGTSSYAVYLYGGNSINFVNNLFSAIGGGFAFYTSSPSSIGTSDYNDFYTTGSYLAYWSGYQTDLASLLASSGKDAHSVSRNPLYNTNTDLHVQEVSLNKAATPLSEVTFDFDGEARDISRPDIGADEFAPPLLHDAGITALVNPHAPFHTDTNFVNVVITNYGSDTLKSAIIQWRVNDTAQTSFTWTGSIATGDFDTVTIGKYDFNLGIAYKIKAYSSSPNGYADSFNLNDTFEVSNIYAALNGTYTIGGTNPDFGTFTQAVTVLNRGGVVGPVIFNVRNGIYNEAITIDQYPGSSASRPVRFQSEMLDSTQVVLTSSNDGIIVLNGADYITFKKMTVRYSYTGSYARIIVFQNGACYNSVSGNILQGYNSGSSYEYYSVIYSPSTNDNHNTISNNLIKYGSYGIYMMGIGSVTTEGSNQIIGNIFDNQEYAAIISYYQDNLIIDHNIISTSSSSGSFKGIYLYYCVNGNRITNNKITIPNGDVALYLSSCSSTSTTKSLAYNNFITIGGTSTAEGIYVYSSPYFSFYFNNVNSTGTNVTDSRTLFVNSSSNNEFYNNNFINSGGGYAVYWVSASLISSNYNNLYSNGSKLGFFSSNISNLAGWKSVTYTDTNSVSVNPLFISSTDLHVREVTLNQSGKTISGITKDIDGETRNVSRPDIGADEFNVPYGNDAGIFSINAPVVAFPAGTSAVKVSIKNFGYDTLKSATIRWTVNGVAQTPKSWTGRIISGRTDTTTIGSFLFRVGVKYDIAAYTISPNGLRDSLNINDTGRKNGIYTALSGIYTIGGTTPDFPDFTTAAASLNSGGILGPVTFNVRTGVYNEQIIINHVYGSSATNKITFQSEDHDSNLVKLTYNSSSYITNYILLMYDADYITFKQMTFEATNNTYGRCIELSNTASNNKFLNNVYEGIDGNGYYDNNAIIYSANENNNNNEFRNSVFNNGSYGLYLLGSGSPYESGIVISNNLFNSQVNSALFLYFLTAPEISYNTIDLKNTYASQSGITLQNCYNGAQLFSNKITLLSDGTGIDLRNADGTSGTHFKIYNNFISAGGTTYSYGIYLNYCDYIDFIYNSIHVTTHNATEGRCIYNDNSNNNTSFKNNIFCNSGGGYTLYFNSTGSINECDYNDFYSNGTYLAYYVGNRTNLASLKTVSGFDNHSKSFDPFFFSPTDLHVSQINLDSSATPISSITKDIDNQTRNSSHPDIGADEFTYVSNDVGISAILKPGTGCGHSNTDSVIVTIQNFGGLTQSNFNVGFKLNNLSPVVKNIGSASIAKGGNLVFKFDTSVDLSSFGIYTLKCYTSLSTDTIHVNDTSTLVFGNYQSPNAVTNMLPADSTVNLSNYVTFSWSPASGATSYDLYIWFDSLSQPVTPTVSNITQISYTHQTNLLYGKLYKWRIVAKNAYCQTAGPIKRFALRYLPDLIVYSVTVPSSVYSGQTFSLSWQIKNIGLGSTLSSSWYDIAYLSADAVLNTSTDFYLGGLNNMSSLGNNQSYSQSSTFTIPQGLSGNYYIFIVTDYYDYVLETSNTNNSGINSSPMMINLTPPPDLIVTNIVKASTVYSGTTTTISWTGKNDGTGNTVTNQWDDAIYLGQDTAFNSANCYFLGSVHHSGLVMVDSTYTLGKTVSLPQAIFGTYYIFVKTDYLNTEYEHALENNNVLRSDALAIVLTPPPDLIVTDMVNPDSVSNGESIQVQYMLQNQGGNSPDNGWSDRVYLSQTKTFSVSTAINLGDRYHSANLDPGNIDTLYKTIQIPGNIGGKYYIFVKCDINNNVFEYTYESNNLSAPDSVIISPPDMVVSSISNTNSAWSGTSIPFSWKDKNNSKGKLINRYWTDRIYISGSNIFNLSTSTVLKDVAVSTTSLNPGATKTNSTSIVIPNGISGTYYLFVYTDINNIIYEGSYENNNVKKIGHYPECQLIALA